MTWTHRVMAGLAALALITAAMGCSSGGPRLGARPADTTAAPGASAAATPADPAVDHHDPQAVCTAFAVATHRIDTTTDAGPEDAYRRAAAYVDADLAAAIAGQTAVARAPQWQEWAAHQASVDVVAAPYPGDALPPNTDRETHRAVLLTATPLGRDGWRGPSQRHTVICALRTADAGWRIHDYGTG